MEEIKIGLKLTKKITTTSAMSAAAMGSGDMEVYATPSMVAFMENVAMNCIAPFLEDGNSTVGIMLSTSHIKATAIGASVEATATVTAIDGRKVSFSIEAKDESGIIGEATHDRFVVNREKFLSRVK